MRRIHESEQADVEAYEADKLALCGGRSTPSELAEMQSELIEDQRAEIAALTHERDAALSQRDDAQWDYQQIAACCWAQVIEMEDY